MTSKATPWRVPLVAWIVVGVVAIHAVVFWVVADRRVLPRTRSVPPVPTRNFGAAERRSVDPRTGETTTERQFQVSTTLAPSPRSSPRPTPGER